MITNDAPLATPVSIVRISSRDQYTRSTYVALRPDETTTVALSPLPRLL